MCVLFRRSVLYMFNRNAYIVFELRCHCHVDMVGQCPADDHLISHWGTRLGNETDSQESILTSFACHESGGLRLEVRSGEKLSKVITPGSSRIISNNAVNVTGSGSSSLWVVSSKGAYSLGTLGNTENPKFFAREAHGFL